MPILAPSDEDDSEADEFDDPQDVAGADIPSVHSIPLDSESNPQLRELRIYFPSYDPQYLEDILLQVNGDIDMAKHLLS